MRRIVCARIRDTGEFDVIATQTSNSDAAKTQTNISSCPLADFLPHLTSDFDMLFQRLVEMGIITFEHGHPAITYMASPCPYVQAQQQKTQPQESEQHESL